MDQSYATASIANHEARQRCVQIALCPRIMGRYLRDRFAQSDGDRTPACHILDAKYEPGAYATILYQLGSRLLIGTLRWDRHEAHAPESSRTIEQIGMRVYPFPDDPALPGLAAAMQPQTMTQILSAALPDCTAGRAKVLRCRTTLLRFRPGKRCTLRLDLWLRDRHTGALAARTMIAKLYHKAAKAQAVYEEMRRLAESPPVRDSKIVIAQALALVPDMPMVVQTILDGTPLHLLLGAQGPNAGGENAGWAGTICATEALAALHAAPPATERVRSIEAELLRFQQRAAQIAKVDAALGARLETIAAALPDWLECLPAWGAEIGLVHGDCKPSQFLIGPAAVALLDFDHCGIADPASDIGTFMATLRQMAARQALKAGSAADVQQSAWLQLLEQQALDAYCQASGRGAELRLRATWYEAVALIRKALRSFARSPKSPLTDALVAEAWRCLQVLPPVRSRKIACRSRVVEKRFLGE